MSTASTTFEKRPRVRTQLQKTQPQKTQPRKTKPPKIQPPQPGEGQVHPTARSLISRHPAVHMIRLSIHSKVLPCPILGMTPQLVSPSALKRDRFHSLPKKQAPKKANTKKTNPEKSTPEKANLPTRRTPGSPHSKKSHPPPPRSPHQSAHIHSKVLPSFHFGNDFTACNHPHQPWKGYGFLPRRNLSRLLPPGDDFPHPCRMIPPAPQLHMRPSRMATWR
jgi:hypothetical protein